MTSRNVLRGFASRLTLLVLLAACWSSSQVGFAYPTIPAVEVWEQPDMPKGDYVIGRDTGSTFVFGGRYCFLYGDTAMSQANSEGLQWVNNSMYHTADNNGDDGISGGYNFSTSGQAALQFVPNSPPEVTYNNSHTDKKVVWTSGAFMDPNTSKQYVWFGLVSVNGGSYSGIGTGFAEVTSLTSKATRIQHRPGQSEDYLMFLESEGAFGCPCVVSNGYVYAYYINGGAFGAVYVARASLTGEAFKTRANWQFYNGSTWVNDPASKLDVTGGVGSVGSIAWNTYLNCWLYTYVEWVGDRMCMRVADNLWGPWSAAKVCFTGQHSAGGGTPYSGQAYPMIEKESGRTQYTSYATPMGTDNVQRVAMVRTRFYTPVTTPATGVWYKVIAKHSGKAMDVALGATTDGAPVWQYSTTGNTAQQWQLVSAGSGYYKLQVRHSSKYLDCVGTAAGTNLQQWASQTTNDQQFSLVSKGSGYFAIKTRQTGGRVLNVAGSTEAQEARIQLSDDVSSASQQFAFAIP